MMSQQSRVTWGTLVWRVVSRSACWRFIGDALEGLGGDLVAGDVAGLDFGGELLALVGVGGGPATLTRVIPGASSMLVAP
jgi:hypothetical protein